MKKQSLATDALLRNLRSLEAERKLLQSQLDKLKTRLLTMNQTESQIDHNAKELEQEIRDLASDEIKKDVDEVRGEVSRIGDEIEGRNSVTMRVIRFSPTKENGNRT